MECDAGLPVGAFVCRAVDVQRVRTAYADRSAGGTRRERAWHAGLRCKSRSDSCRATASRLVRTTEKTILTIFQGALKVGALGGASGVLGVSTA